MCTLPGIVESLNREKHSLRIKTNHSELLSGPVVKTLRSQRRGPGPIPSQETRSYMLQSSLYAATKAPNNQINKLKEPKKTQTALTPSAFQKLEFSN